MLISSLTLVPVAYSTSKIAKFLCPKEVDVSQALNNSSSSL